MTRVRDHPLSSPRTSTMKWTSQRCEGLRDTSCRA
jgi:hypothetical protein